MEQNNAEYFAQACTDQPVGAQAATGPNPYPIPPSRRITARAVHGEMWLRISRGISQGVSPRTTRSRSLTWRPSGCPTRTRCRPPSTSAPLDSASRSGPSRYAMPPARCCIRPTRDGHPRLQRRVLPARSYYLGLRHRIGATGTSRRHRGECPDKTARPRERRSLARAPLASALAS
jgi:hypothetical protein